MFQHEPLNILKNEIRLLHLSDLDTDGSKSTISTKPLHQTEVVICSLKRTSLTKAPPYVALSYTWGKAKADHVLQIDGNSFQIRPNLQQALKHLYEVGVRCVWVDAICINQGDLIERARQVLRLATVFQKAEYVVAWLGLHDEFSRIVFERLNPPETPRTMDDKQPSLTAAVRKLVARDYWSRMWVVQEFAVAKELYIMCEKDVVSYEMFNRMIFAYNGRNGFLVMPSMLMELRERYSMQKSYRFLELKQLTSAWTNQGKDETALARIGSLFKSSDILDQIYGLLGLTSDADIFVPEPDYDISANQLLIEITKSAIVNTGKLDFILLEHRGEVSTHADYASRTNVTYEPSKLPSWCPDYISLLDTENNKELNNAIFSTWSDDLTFRINHSRVKDRLGSVALSWCATGPILQYLRRDMFTFDDRDNRLSVKGRLLGEVGDCDEWVKEYKTDAEWSSKLYQIVRCLFELLSSYCANVIDAEKDFSTCISALALIRDASQCQQKSCVNGEDCEETRRSVLSRLQLDKNSHDLAPHIFGMLNSGFTKQTFNVSKTPLVSRMTCEIVRSLFFNFFTFDRKVAPYRKVNADDHDVNIGLDGWNFGWVPPSTKPGDQIWLLAGCSMPVVVRNNAGPTKNVFVKIGPAVVNGAMTGKMWVPERYLTEIAIE